VYLTGINLTGVHLTGMHLMSVSYRRDLTGVQLVGGFCDCHQKYLDPRQRP